MERNNFDNAVYSGFLLFGDGNPNGERKTPLVSRDVVAHEASHGLIENTAGLLVAEDSVCIDTFRRVIQVAPARHQAIRCILSLWKCKFQ